MLCQSLALIFGMPRQSTSSSSPMQSRASWAEEDLSGAVSELTMVSNAKNELAMRNDSYKSLWGGKCEVCIVDKACQLLFRESPLTQLQRQTLGSLPSFQHTLIGIWADGDYLKELQKLLQNQPRFTFSASFTSSSNDYQCLRLQLQSAPGWEYT